MKKVNWTLLFFITCLMAGCSAKQHFELATYSKSQSRIYPPVSVVLNNGEENQAKTTCTGTGCYFYRNNDDRFVLTALRGSTLFERVDLNNPYAETKLEIKFTDFHAGNDSAEYAKLLVYAGTLGAIPTTTKKESNFDVVIKNGNSVLKTYSYKANYTETNSLFIDPESGSENVVNYFVSLLLKDIESDQLFSSAASGGIDSQ